MNKKLIGVLIAIVVVICGYLYASPYFALNNIKKAAQAGDSDTVSKYIDYPSVRQSFKDQVNAMMAKELMNQDTDGFAALGAMLALGKGSGPMDHSSAIDNAYTTEYEG